MQSQSIFTKFEELEKKLLQSFFGQNRAVKELIKALIHIELQSAPQNYKAIITFLGPHNCGKLYLAQLLARFNPDYEAIRVFDMAQFTDPNDQKRLLGPKGELTKFVKENPNSIVVFKDIEKADNIIQLAILSFLKEAPGIKNTLFIFTTTAGSNLLKKEEFWKFYFQDPLKAQAKLIEYVAKEKKIIYDIVESAIDAELLSTMVQNYIIIFRHLSFNAIVKIADLQLQNSIQTLEKKLQIAIKIKEKAILKPIVLSFAPYINARRVSKKIPDLLIDIIAKAYAKTKSPIKKIVFELVAKDFLKKIDKEFLHNLIKKNETVVLQWKEIQNKETLHIQLVGISVKKLPHYVSATEKPISGYSTISFDDVAGQKLVKNSLKEIIKIIKNPELVKKFSVNMPKGMLLYGPKGVGKTLLAYAFAKEANMPYVLLSGTDLFAPNLIHLAFNKAKELNEAIVLVDGLDNTPQAPIAYDALIDEIDALQNEDRIFVLITAINKDHIDKNLLSSERIDILIEVPELDMQARKFFIKKILQMPHEKIDIDKVARYMSGLSGYEMQRVAKEAALYVMRKNLPRLTEEILIEQINNIKYGQKVDKKRIRNIEEDLKKTAYHEAGHAVLSYILLPDIKIEQVTITPRAEALGFVSYSDEFITNISKEELFSDICVALAGRIAKKKRFPDEGEDTGAAQDLEQATWEAYNLVAVFGMDEKVGYIHVDTLNQNVNKEFFKNLVEERIAYWIDKATKRAQELVETYWDKIEKVAQELIKKEYIDGEELKKIMNS